MAEKKKILVMVASPKNERSGTLIPTKAFVQGLEENGDYETEYLFIDRLNIKPCRGCLSCWGRPDGSCFIKDDDIPMVREKLINSDIVIWSFPLFLFGIPGQMKVMFDRQVYGMMRDTPRFPEPLMKGKKCILISTCTTPWPWNILFKQSRGAIRAMREIARYAGFKIVKTIERGGTAMHPELTEKDKQKCRKAFERLYI
jgi:putative NADPH-quinone reductase